MNNDNVAFCDVLFPSFVIYADNKKIVTEKVINKSKEIIKQYGKTTFFSPCRTTVETQGFVLELEEFNEIKTFIGDIVGTYCDRLKINKEGLKFSCSWLNLYDKYGYQDLHAHSDSMLSGVFYLQSKEEKDLIFQAPWHFFQPIIPNYLENNLENCHNVEYASVVGRCYLFPSHLMHRTLPAKSSRMSLSFNVTY